MLFLSKTRLFFTAREKILNKIKIRLFLLKNLKPKFLENRRDFLTFPFEI